MKILFVAFSFFVLAASSFAAAPVILADSSGCARAQRGMNFQVMLGTQRYSYSGLCGSSFNSTAIGGGWNCTVKADLCSKGGRAISVSCRDGSNASLPLSCAQ